MPLVVAEERPSGPALAFGGLVAEAERSLPASTRGEILGLLDRPTAVARRCSHVNHSLKLPVLHDMDPAQSVDLTTETLTKRIRLPMAWTEQTTLLGFD